MNWGNGRQRSATAPCRAMCMRRRAVSAYLKRTPLPVLDAAVVICALAWQFPGCCFTADMAQLAHAQCNAPAAVSPCEIEVGPAKT